MFTIKFTAPVGDERISVDIGDPHGNSGEYYHITIDNMFCGSIAKRNGDWIQLHINRYEFTMDDIQILGEMVDSKLRKTSTQ